MRKLNGHIVGIDQGELVLFNDYENDGPMWAGEGQRDVRVPVKFSEAFEVPPSVTLSLSLCDMSNEAFLRMDLRAQDITATGFQAAFATWGDTKIARVRVTWLAIGAVSSDDAWDI